jgi:hypothetical protein
LEFDLELAAWDFEGADWEDGEGDDDAD